MAQTAGERDDPSAADCSASERRPDSMITPSMVEAGVKAYLRWEKGSDPYIKNMVRQVLDAALSKSDLVRQPRT